MWKGGRAMALMLMRATGMMLGRCMGRSATVSAKIVKVAACGEMVLEQWWWQ